MSYQLRKLAYQKVHQGYAFTVIRDAALWPLVRSRKMLYTDDEIIAAVEDLRAQRRGRLYALKAKGWSALADDDNAAFSVPFAINCPPFGVQTATKLRPCRRVRFCPFCYAREVLMPACWAVEVVVKTLRALEIAKNFKFVASRKIAKSNLAHMTADEWLRLAHNALPSSVGVLSCDGKVFGSLTDASISPGEGPGDILCRFSSLSLVRADQVIPEIAGMDFRAVSASRLWESMHLIAWAFRYPVGHMRGDPAVAVALLEAMAESSYRLTRSAGVMRADAWYELTRSVPRPDKSDKRIEPPEGLQDLDTFEALEENGADDELESVGEEAPGFSP